MNFFVQQITKSFVILNAVDYQYNYQNPRLMHQLVNKDSDEDSRMQSNYMLLVVVDMNFEKELSNDRIETNLLFVYLARSRGC